MTVQASKDRRATRYSRHRDEREKAILAQTMKVMAAHGVRTLTIDDIADHIGITKPALYRYYASKEALIDAVLRRAKQELLDSDISAGKNDWRDHLMSGLRFIAVRPETFLILYRHAANDPEYHSHYETYFEQVSALTASRINISIIAPAAPLVPSQFFVRTLVSFLFGAILSWIENGCEDIDAFHQWMTQSATALTQSWASADAAHKTDSKEHHNAKQRA